MNINKIKLSGTTYNIQDQNATKTVELTQAQYDALAVKDPNTFYIITDAEGADLTNYYTKSETSGATEISTALANKADTATTYTKTETDNAITTATSTKQDTLVSGTSIKTINNESILGSGNITIEGGGKAIEAGRGISVTTGETADTVSFSLPISAGTRTNSIIIGAGESTNSGSLVHGIGSTSNGVYSNVLGYYCYSNGHYSFLAGGNLNNSVECGAAFGKYNTTTNSPLFSVGNGTSESTRHNAFEIRQNGDIYITKDGQDVKLQDQLGGSITVDTALDSGSTNPVENRVIYNKIDEVEQVTAAGLNALNDAFGGLKLMKISQTDYDNLQVKDQNTLYIVI